ncbi:DNA double-strand break repair nuclease NurA [Thermoproteus tenax]|uniref:Predicted NurA-like nuclease n=1 Tax=Thermoproteus tenax (strain ATCC 35583 / DSM 2078 / JCM 9277 / NBRC 100435 / Kra 1) TaxID=768679 RepID=G4RK03_THETK|nr:DNA double-strand break repair nuclease NurA [Thermoproteus tenax]CCC81898.1 Predicted NurA-like nuclease [Thermoproteus tenax Kra 1]
MEDVLKLARLLELFADRAAESLPPPPPEEVEGQEGAVDCPYWGVSWETAEPPGGLWALDSQTSVVEFEGASVIVATGALVGAGVALVPGLGARWLGLRFNFPWRDPPPDLGPSFYVVSEHAGVVFDSRVDLETVRDEVRSGVELALAKAWDRSGYLLVDGPIFRAAGAAERGGIAGAIYRGIMESRASALRGRAVGVVKRIERATYLAQCVGEGANDEVAARRLLDGRPGRVGPIAVTAAGLTKWVYYVGSPTARGIRVLRVEAMSPEVAEEAASWLPALAGADGVPIPISVADRIARRLNAGALKVLYGATRAEPTYSGYEVLARAFQEL